ncbi:MAG: hypothetical protein QOF53_1118 [Nocardioidaceae bacterium]|jgi:hypothetical protein|nr:hypothetical protein [Nocardioidaceae bacterium]
MSQEPTEASSEADARPEQHGPEMDDTQVEATGELRDRLEPVTDDDARG